MGTKQTALTDISDGSTDSFQPSLHHELSEIGISTQAVDSLTEVYPTLDELLTEPDHSLYELNHVGKETITTIRRELDSSVSEDYTITELNSGCSEAEWTEPANVHKDILIGEAILEELRENHFETASDLQESVHEWARNYSQAETVADELIVAAYELSRSDIKDAHLYDIDDLTKEVTDNDPLSDDKQLAVHKARSLMAYCTLTDHRSVYSSASATAKDRINDAEQQQQAEQERRKKAKHFLKFPDDEIAGWQRINYSPNYDHCHVAYRGKYHDCPSVVALYDDPDSELVRVSGFRLADWVIADQDPLEATFNFATGTTPDTKVDGAIALREWLQANPVPEDPIEPAKIDYNGWYVVKDAPETFTYEDPHQNAQITADGNTITLKANGKQQTVTAKSHREAKRDMIEYLAVNPGIEADGDPITVPLPDDLTENTEQVPLEEHPAVATIDIEDMVLENTAEGWDDFPHPSEITAHLDPSDDIESSTTLPPEIKDTIDELTDDPNIGDFLIFDAQAAYEYLEKLQHQSDLHLENFHRRQLIVDSLAQNDSLSNYDKKWIVEWEVRRRLALRDDLETWGQKVEHKLDPDNHGLPT